MGTCPVGGASGGLAGASFENQTNPKPSPITGSTTDRFRLIVDD
jgi:hypothetical protein